MIGDYKMNINHNYFSDEAIALAEIEAAGYSPVTLEFPAESNDDHWHDFDSMLYILEGEVTITYAQTGETCVCGTGTKIIGQPRVLHHEQTDGYKALIGLSVEPEKLTQPINKPPPVDLN
jgi:quercetin dioxygenase-like cupin family protein